MVRQYVSLVLVVVWSCVLLLVNPVPVEAQADDGRQGAEIKKEVTKRTLNGKTRVDIKLRNGNTLNGYIIQAGEDDFVIKGRNTGAITTLAYRDVRQVRGTGSSLGAKIAVGTAIYLGLVLLGAAL
jgi:hypothetical protein